MEVISTQSEINIDNEFNMPSFLKENPFDIQEAEEPIIIETTDEVTKENSNLLAPSISIQPIYSKHFVPEFMDNNFWRIDRMVDEIPEV